MCSNYKDKMVVISHEVSMPRERHLELSNRYTICQMPRQQRSGDACQISKRNNNLVIIMMGIPMPVTPYLLLCFLHIFTSISMTKMSSIYWFIYFPCEEVFRADFNYRQVSNIRRTLIGNGIVDNSDVVGASPIGAAPTTSSLST